MNDRRQDTSQRRGATGQQDWPASPSGTQRNTESSSKSTDDQSVRDRAKDFAGETQHKIDDRREQAGETMEHAAESVRSHADQIPGGERTSEMANQAADRVEGVAGYLKDNDMSAMIEDLETVVRDHPKESLIAAAAAGFLVGRTLRS